jgi:hypothetical protein
VGGPREGLDIRLAHCEVLGRQVGNSFGGAILPEKSQYLYHEKMGIWLTKQ